MRPQQNYVSIPIKRDSLLRSLFCYVLNSKFEVVESRSIEKIRELIEKQIFNSQIAQSSTRRARRFILGR